MGAMIAAVLLSSRCLGPLGQIAGLFGRLHASKAAYEKLDALMTECKNNNSNLNSDSISPETLGDLEYKNLSIGYEENQQCIKLPNMAKVLK